MTTQTENSVDTEIDAEASVGEPLTDAVEAVAVPEAPQSMSGLLGRKIGMTTIYDDMGRANAVTVVEVGPCFVIQVKTQQRDGYQAVQLGFMRARKVNSPMAGHFERSGGSFRHLQEFQVGDLGDFEVGQEIRANVFEAGDAVKVTGRSKGKGFQGVVKRHGFAGGPKTHGQSDRHRSPGSIGAGTSPGRVWPGTKMAGHMGARRVTTRGLSILRVDPVSNYVLVKGAVPGSMNSVVRLEKLVTA